MGENEEIYFNQYRPGIQTKINKVQFIRCSNFRVISYYFGLNFIEKSGNRQK